MKMAEANQRNRPVPDLGVGIGLRVPHFKDIFSELPDIDFFEIISENFMVDGGPPLKNLARILEHYQVVMHGVSMGIGSSEELDKDYLKRLKHLADYSKSPWLSTTSVGPNPVTRTSTIYCHCPTPQR